MKLINMLWLLLVAIGCYGNVITDAEAFIKANESFRDKPYRDAKGFAIGYGFTDPQYSSREYMSQEEADRILHDIVLDIDAYIDKRVYVQLTDSQRVALIDFIYQYGKGRFLNSYLRCLINNATEDRVVAEMAKYTKVNGVYNDHVAKRTQKRIELWQK